MITGIDTSFSKEYTSRFDTTEPKTIWRLGVLSAHAFAYVGSKFSETEQSKNIEASIETVRFGLRGFDGFKDSNGNDIVFETQPKSIGQHNYQIVKDRIINLIPVSIVMELSNELILMAKLTEIEQKN